MRIDDLTAPAAVKVDWPVVARRDLSGDKLEECLNPAGGAFWAAEASADMLLVK
jgi:hypothetical protein